MGLGLLVQIGLFTHLIARLEPAFGSGIAASAISLVTLCAIAGRWLLARWFGEHDRRVAAALNLLVQAVGSLPRRSERTWRRWQWVARIAQLEFKPSEVGVWWWRWSRHQPGGFCLRAGGSPRLAARLGGKLCRDIPGRGRHQVIAAAVVAKGRHFF